MTDERQNVRPLRKPELSHHAKRILARVEFAGDMQPVLDRPYVVKNWFDRGCVSVVYGEANTGKSFWAADLAHHVHNGIDWGGQRVRQGAVLYIAAEGGAMFDRRLIALKATFMVVRGQMTLAGKNSDTVALADVINHLSEVHGPFALIVVDTLARVMGAAEENTSDGIGTLIQSTDVLRDRTGAHVMFIHHSGKDSAKGARGHSSLRAAIDTEIEIGKPEPGDARKIRTARVTKQRDMEGGKEMAFRLEVVRLGLDSDGDPVTTCIVKEEGGRT